MRPEEEEVEYKCGADPPVVFLSLKAICSSTSSPLHLFGQGVLKSTFLITFIANSTHSCTDVRESPLLKAQYSCSGTFT